MNSGMVPVSWDEKMKNLSAKYTETAAPDGSIWSIVAEFRSGGVLVASYVAGKLTVHSPVLKDGSQSVKSQSVINSFKCYAEEKLGLLNSEFFILHNELYQLTA